MSSVWMVADILVRTHPLTRDVAKSSIDVVVVAGYAAYRCWPSARWPH
jgi:hypothetical protein